MKYLLLFCAMTLAGCAHAYVQQFGNGQVTACCPQKKLACSQSALSDLAVQHCGGPVRTVSGGSVESGASAVYGSGYADVGVSRISVVTASVRVGIPRFHHILFYAANFQIQS